MNHRLSLSWRARRAATSAAAGVALWLGLAAGGCGGQAGQQSVSEVCGSLFDATIGAGCEPAMPTAELARQRTRYQTLCERSLGLPGEGITTSALQSCVSALKSEDLCVKRGLAPLPSACRFASGSLGTGATCASSEQCASGACSTGGLPVDGGAPPLCGTCVAAVAVGQPCGAAVGFMTCQQGAVCTGSSPSATCVAIAYGDAGALCDGTAMQCKDGLTCGSTGTCAAPKPAGASCAFTDECASPLVCAAGTNGSTCSDAGKTGASCTGDGTCATGFGCSTATQQCGALTYAAAGQPCGDLVRCLVGSCAATGGGTTPGTCPRVLADGQPCAAPSSGPTTCDAFASCTTDGLCTLGPPSCP